MKRSSQTPTSPRLQAEQAGAPGAKHDRLGAAVFRGKVTLLQARRLARDLSAGRVPRHARGVALADAEVVAESVTDLWTEANAAERELQAGKVHNLRVASRRLDGLEIPAGAVFSFWRQVGRATRRRGYARGRELREGCLIPNVGGGLCQLSNALYDAALKAGFRVLERHAHTRVVPGSLAEVDRDATVFWNYVDLRWVSDAPYRLECHMTAEQLVVRVRAKRGGRGEGEIAARAFAAAASTRGRVG
jgi:vancomycin resistance protein YoaR